ncbi:MAG: hypothetical protein WAP35_01355 [Solirubrobacterales bacterium]
MQYLLIPTVLGAITGVVGRRKGMSFPLWFVIGFILPFIGLTAAILSRDERQDPRRECPRCAKLLPITAQVCMRCGEDIEYPDELVIPEAHERAR